MDRGPVCQRGGLIAFQICSPGPLFYDIIHFNVSPSLFKVSTPPCWREERAGPDSRVCSVLELTVCPGIAAWVLPLQFKRAFEFTFNKDFCVGHYSPWVCLLSAPVENPSETDVFYLCVGPLDFLLWYLTLRVTTLTVSVTEFLLASVLSFTMLLHL